jgi:acyl-CoA thioesterase FadM
MASLLDESIGLCAEAYREFVAKDSLSRLYTANLEVSYRAPVPAPGILVIETWLKKKEGRKYFLEARVLSENGIVMVEAKSLYISARPPAAL